MEQLLELWFQRIHYSDGVTEEFLPRLKPAGYEAVVLTVDTLSPFPLDANVSREIPDRGKMFGSLRHRPDLIDDPTRDVDHCFISRLRRGANRRMAES